MLNILKSDFFKLKKSKAFWVCSVLCVAIAALMVVAMDAGIKRVLASEGNRAGGQLALTAEQVSGVFALERFLPSGFHLIFIAVFTSIFTTAEFSHGTIKNMLSRGANRVKVFFSKFITVSCAALFMLALFMLTLLLSGTLVWGYDPGGTATVSGLIGMMALQALLVLAYTAVFTFLSMTLRSGGASIAANIISATMFSTLLGALSMLFGDSVDLTQYWLEDSLAKLSTTVPASADVIQGILVALGWSAASIITGTLLFRKLDVK